MWPEQDRPNEGTKQSIAEITTKNSPLQDRAGWRYRDRQSQKWTDLFRREYADNRRGHASPAFALMRERLIATAPRPEGGIRSLVSILPHARRCDPAVNALRAFLMLLPDIL
jgi:hypothetical protein